MMTEDQILSLAHRTCWKYRHSTDPHHSHTYKFNAHDDGGFRAEG